MFSTNFRGDKDVLTTFEITSMEINEKKSILPIYLSTSIPKGTEGEVEITFEGTLDVGASEAFFQTTVYEDQSGKSM